MWHANKLIRNTCLETSKQLHDGEYRINYKSHLLISIHIISVIISYFINTRSIIQKIPWALQNGKHFSYFNCPKFISINRQKYSPPPIHSNGGARVQERQPPGSRSYLSGAVRNSITKIAKNSKFFSS